MNIFKFMVSSPRFLAFGFLAAFFSSFGQTFFISLSGADIRAAFDLSHGDFGMIYSAATLTSAMLLVWAGRKIDDLDLRLYTVLVCVGLAMACLGMSIVASAFWLYPILFGLRFCGQGLLSHISATSMARYFDANRGKAISIAAMGYPVGEALLPIMVVTVIAGLGWRQMWGGIGIFLAISMVPTLLWLLKGHGERHRKLEEHTRQTARQGADGPQWSRRHVLRDPRFYILLPSILAAAFLVTGFFFHQVHLVQTKGWSMTLFAGAFVVYAIGQLSTSLLAGVLVDKFGAVKIVRFYLFPMVFALLLLAGFDALWTMIAFMAFLGSTAGLGQVVNSAIWAEIYGVTHLGAIKALGTALGVLSSALSPPIMGWAIDRGVSMETIALYGAVYCVAAACLAGFVFPRFDRAARPS
jgi:MFS family permease